MPSPPHSAKPRAGWPRRALAVLARRYPWLVLAGCILVPLGFLGYYNWANDRSFIVAAETDGLSVTFDGRALASWALDGAFVCVPRPDGEAAPPGAAAIPLCSAEAYDVHSGSLAFSWPEQAAARLTLQPDGSLVVLIESAAAPVPVADDLPELPPYSRIIVPRAALEAAGSLRFSGQVTIGEQPGDGRLGLLRAGRFEARERLRGQEQPTTILKGDFYPGDKVSFGSDDTIRPAVGSYGMLRLAAPPAVDLDVLAISEPGRTHLAVTRIGSGINARTGAGSEIRPSWIDRFLNDPLQIGIVAVFGLGAALLAVIVTAIDLVRREPGPPV